MLKTIIQTTTIALICLSTISCEKEVPIKGDSISEPTAETESSSLDDFTVILSKAVANDKDLRDFIKVESLKQFDKDWETRRMSNDGTKALLHEETYNMLVPPIMMLSEGEEVVEEVVYPYPLMDENEINSSDD